MSQPTHADPVHVAYLEGRRLGLATAALAVSVVAFVNLLGVEKSVLAAVLAVLALQGAQPLGRVLSRGKTALIIAAVHALTIVAILFLFHDKLMQLLHLLHKLG
jgi:hypothetical protein